jgi:hypothetical protein
MAQAQQAPAPPEAIPALQKPGASPTSVEEIRKHVETGHDAFTSELYDEEIKDQLGALKKVLKHRPLDPAEFSRFLAADFRGTPLAPARRLRVHEAAPTVDVYQPGGELTVIAASFPQEMDRWLAAFVEIGYIEFKTTNVVIEQPAPAKSGSDPPLVTVEIRYDFTGRAAAGQPRQHTGTWNTRWRQDPERGWLWAGVAVEEGREEQSPRSLFTDVTRCLVGKNEAAYAQLLRGADWWTANTDAAFAMPVDGHTGVAVADVDGDGREDFYLCQFSGLPDRLFRAEADGSYAEISRQAGVDILDPSHGAVFFDYDNDGDPDLLVTGWQLMLFQNDGRGRFTLLDSAQAGLNPRLREFSSFYSACVGDYNRDAWLDFYVTAYSWETGSGKLPNPIPYHDATNGPPNFLFRNNGDGTFADVTREVGLDQNNVHFSFACAWADYDRNGWPDLYVANDFGRNNLYRNEGGQFRDVAAEAGVEDIGAGMSVSWGDYDNDGWLDLYVGNMWSSAGLRTTAQTSVWRTDKSDEDKSRMRRMAKGNSLFRNLGNGAFVEVTDRAGVAFGRWAWSSQFLDLNLDGREDLFVTNGYVTNESNKDL